MTITNEQLQHLADRLAIWPSADICIMAKELLAARTQLAEVRGAAKRELGEVRGYLACTSGPAWAGEWQDAMKHAIERIDERLRALAAADAAQGGAPTVAESKEEP